VTLLQGIGIVMLEDWGFRWYISYKLIWRRYFDL